MSAGTGGMCEPDESGYYKRVGLLQAAEEGG